MSSAELLALQAGFVARLEAMAAFLSAATDTFKTVNHTMTELESAGFHYCMEALRRNARGVVDTDKIIQDMEAANG